jgi:hypothetical protein
MEIDMMGDPPDFRKEPDFTVVDVEVLRAPYLRWQTASAGFGEVRFYRGEDGRVHCENECMSRDFVKSVLMRLVDDAVWD